MRHMGHKLLEVGWFARQVNADRSANLKATGLGYYLRFVNASFKAWNCGGCGADALGDDHLYCQHCGRKKDLSDAR